MSPHHTSPLLVSLLLALAALHGQPSIAAAASPVSSVQALRQGENLFLINDEISASWSVREGTLRPRGLTNELTGTGVPLVTLLKLVPREGPVLDSTDFKIVGEPVLEEIPVAAGSPRSADHMPGRQIRVELEDASTKLHLTWKAILHDDANYIRQELTIHAVQQPFPLAQIVLIDLTVPGAQVSGQVKGSPVTAWEWFFGFEHPLSDCRVDRGEHASCWLSRELPLQPGQSVTYSSVFGVTHRGQTRRDFLNYVELERAHPYRTFLHYNSWYDLGYFDRYNELGALAVVQAFGEQLTKQRGVKLDSFLFDDGWDDPTTLWKFNPGFPNGLTKVAEVAARYGAAPGIWLSPWGGYDKPKEQRLAAARPQGFETNEGGFALSGRNYYRYFRDTCLDLIDKYGINQFKFDGTGNANEVIKGSEFDSDFDAAIHLIGTLRAKKPDVYINLTTGTYPSPFWLLYADSIWRGGDDHSFAGVGSNRQRWITYRDSDLYRHVVEDGPLFPLNSVMLHGMIYARHAQRLGDDPTHDFADEVHSYFATGTQLQEMYITPSLLSLQDWDVLAEAAKWSRANAQVLKDSHWVGGDPARLEVYGWAAWSPAKAIITLRNPSDRPQDFTGNISALLELPAGAVSTFDVSSPWKEGDFKVVGMFLQPETTFHLKPFEVRMMELKPVPGPKN